MDMKQTTKRSNKRFKVKIEPPVVETEPTATPICPKCGSRHVQKRDWFTRTVKDIHGPIQITQKRYYCPRCSRTFMVYPWGITHRQFTARVDFMVALLYYLGLSFENICLFLRAYGLEMDPSTEWRHWVDMGKAVFGRIKRRRFGSPVVHVDQGYLRVGKEEKCFNIAYSPDGLVLDVEFMDDESAGSFYRVFSDLAERYGARVITGDFHTSHEAACLETGLEFQGCYFHYVRNLKKWKSLLKKHLGDDWKAFYELAKLVSPRNEAEFYEIGMRAPPGSFLREYCLWVSEKLNSLMTGMRFGYGLPPGYTNNIAERGILRTKARVKTTRGLGSLRGAVAFVALTQRISEAMERGSLRPGDLCL